MRRLVLAASIILTWSSFAHADVYDFEWASTATYFETVPGSPTPVPMQSPATGTSTATLMVNPASPPSAPQLFGWYDTPVGKVGGSPDLTVWPAQPPLSPNNPVQANAPVFIRVDPGATVQPPLTPGWNLVGVSGTPSGPPAWQWTGAFENPDSFVLHATTNCGSCPFQVDFSGTGVRHVVGASEPGAALLLALALGGFAIAGRRRPRHIE